jgi:hypothetical protein
VFGHDTLGDEAFWTDRLRLNVVFEDTLVPVTALTLGLKVDADSLPPCLLGSLTPADLADPLMPLALMPARRAGRHRTADRSAVPRRSSGVLQRGKELAGAVVQSPYSGLLDSVAAGL